MLGAKRVVRIGGMSALVAEYTVGSFVAVDKAIKDTGTALTLSRRWRRGELRR